MIQGTTPTHIFKLPIDTGIIQALRITYCQQGSNVIEKTERDVVMSGDTVTCTLTQQETLAFNPRQNIKLQLKVLTASGAVLASAIRELTVHEVLNKEVLT